MAMRRSSVPGVGSSDMGGFVHRVNASAAIVRSALALLLCVWSLSSAAAAPGAQIRIVAFGDSLTAGYGLPPAAAFPVQLQAALKARGHAVEVVNAGVSGDTTAAALDRFDWAVPDNADAAIVELGANDALRGLDPARARANLDAILSKLKARGLPVLLAGMGAPRNLGPEYVAAFDRIYPELAEQHGAILYPFFLDGVALKPELNLRDGIHPTEEGVSVIVARILPQVEALIARVEKARAAAR